MLIGVLAAGQDPGAAEPAAGRALLQGLRRRLDLALRLVLFILAGLAIAAGAALLIRGLAGPATVPDPEPAAAAAGSAGPPREPWVEVNHPLHLFTLSGSAFDKLAPAYRAQRSAAGDARQDLLRFGTFGAETPFLDIAVLRAGASGEQPAPFFVDMVRLGAAANLAVVRSDIPVAMPTRFGAFATADLTLGQGTTALPCLGFRLDPASAVAIRGLACGTPAKPMDRDTLACALDRLDLVAAGDDTALRDVFVAAERRRGRDCTGRATPAGPPRGWLDGDAAAVPAKRGPALRPRS